MFSAIKNLSHTSGLLICIMSCFLSNQPAYCQKHENSPKNFIGLLGGLEWGTTSGALGVEYERAVYKKNHLVIAAKGVYIPRYQYGNLNLGLNRGSYIYKGQSVSYVMLMGSAQYFTAKKTENGGFFLCTGLGTGVNSLKYLTGININNVQLAQNTSISGAFEMGVGLLFNISEKISMRFSGSTIWGDFVGAFTHGKF